MVGKKRRKGRQLADVCSAFGTGWLALLPKKYRKRNPYDLFVSLWLNLDRPHLQRAWDLKTGFQLAQSYTPLEPSLVDSVSYIPEQVESLHYDLNSARSEARSMSRRRSL